MKEDVDGKFIAYARELGRAEFPSPMHDRCYQFPSNYPSPTEVKQAILDPLGVFMFGISAMQAGAVTAKELEVQTASFMTRHEAWKHDHPLYLVTAPLIRMLVATDRLDEPNIDTDSRPPFPAGHFVLPKQMLGVGSAYIKCISYAVLNRESFQGTPVRPPDDLTDRRFYLTAELNDGTAYFAKLHVADDGVVQNPEDSPYDEFTGEAANPSAADNDQEPPTIRMEDGPSLLAMSCNLTLALFTFLNMDRDSDTVELASITGVAKSKRDKPRREFWKPATIGLNLRPTGCATQGNHASPHAHLRRGHWRRQWFGKNRGQVRRLWIKPVLVMGRACDE